MAILSQRAYARQRGVSVSTVQKAIDTGRICVAALNSHNIDYAADAIAKVIR